MTHTCSACGLGAVTHPDTCDSAAPPLDLPPGTPAPSGCAHWPPLCCPGCPCGSYETAHALPVPAR